MGVTTSQKGAQDGEGSCKAAEKSFKKEEVSAKYCWEVTKCEEYKERVSRPLCAIKSTQASLCLPNHCSPPGKITGGLRNLTLAGGGSQTVRR